MFYNLKRVREEYELSQREVAKILKISKSSYNYYETGEYIISLKHLNTSQSNISAYENGKNIILKAFAYNMAKDFNISLDYLIGRSNIIKIIKKQ